MALAFITDNAVEQYPIGAVDVKRRFPNTSFALPLEGQDLSSFGVVEVVSTDQPATDRNTQKLEELTPVFDNGAWRQAWNVIDLSADERQYIEDEAAGGIRFSRNTRLTKSDWTQLADAPLTSEKKAEWATYRQSLRDITSTEGFPFAVTWPAEPS